MPRLQQLAARLGGVIRGKSDAIEILLLGLLTRGHVLIEDVPGVGKTTLAKALARCLGLEMRRIQFTPDLLPSDILGAQVLEPERGTFTFRPGPVFTHLLLADEINRASPRTQSALLEAMSEEQVTVDGITRALPEPFIVLATQNPVDTQGTYPLPEAQLDRFMLRLELGYPAPEDELDMLTRRRQDDPLDELTAVVDPADLQAWQSGVRAVAVAPAVGRYVVDLVGASRVHPQLAVGASPRGSLMLYRAAQARAYMRGRDHALPDDVQAVAPMVLAHRLLLSQAARHGGISTGDVVAGLIESTRVPV